MGGMIICKKLYLRKTVFKTESELGAATAGNHFCANTKSYIKRELKREAYS